MGGRVWGYYDGDELVSACHAGANVVPVQATPDAIEAFADRLLIDGGRPASLVGLRSAVMPLWERVESAWGPARSLRPFQPFLELDGEVSLRVARGFSVTAQGSASRLRDQLSLPLRGATEEEVLLRLRQLESGYEYGFSIGLTYTFGSIFSSVVNPRFGN